MVAKHCCLTPKSVLICATEYIRVLQDTRLTGRMSVAHERHEADIAHGREADLQELSRGADGFVLLPRELAAIQNWNEVREQTHKGQRKNHNPKERGRADVPGDIASSSTTKAKSIKVEGKD